MSKTCARCEKTVYPIEELKCLDKIWHKGCFKCQICGMTLNMKTYKGYNKQPYCEAHIPKVKATTMAETPELKRIAENTKIQSNVTYHAAFEKSKGKFTQVADDPETLRIKQNSKIISNVAYHGDLEKKAAMEKQRNIQENGEFPDASDTEAIMEPSSVSQPIVPGVQNSSGVSSSHYHRPPSDYYSDNYPEGNYTPQKVGNFNQEVKQQGYNKPPVPQNMGHNANYVSSEHNTNHGNLPTKTAVYQNHPGQQHQHHPNQTYSNSTPYPDNRAMYNNMDAYAQNNSPYPNQQWINPNVYPQGNAAYPPNYSVGKIADYDPIVDGPRNSPYTARQSATLIYSSDKGAVAGQPTRRIGSIADIDPINNVYGSLGEAQYHANKSNNVQNPAQQQTSGSNTNTHPGHNIQHPQNPNQNIQGRVYRAMYDYSAQDSDEVSFNDGDLIVNVTSIDEGWMTGTVQRTGHTGMLPANYVENASI